MSPTNAHAARIQQIPLGQLAESPSNPRKNFGDLAELAASIKEKGVLQPVLVRAAPASPDANAYELVFGHRRFRAAKLAGLEELPAMVRELTDKEVLEAQVIENGQREDVHPLEEAEGFERLMKDHGYSVDGIAAKIGKDKSYIYKRLKLLALEPEARESFYEGRITPQVAYLIARVPPELQVDALELTYEQGYRDGPGMVAARQLSAAEVAENIQGKLMRDLERAPFDTKNANLVAAAGACITCPKRTGNQPDLFGDVKGANVCTDTACFKLKRDAAAKAKLAEAKKSGARVLTKEEAKEAFRWGDHRAEGFVSLDDQCYDDPKRRTYRQLLKDSAPVVLARKPQSGELAELLDPKDAKKALAEAGHNFAAEKRLASSSSRAERSPAEIARAKREKFEERVRAETRRRSMAAIVAAVEDEGSGFNTEFQRAVIRAALSEIWADTLARVCERRGIEVKSGERVAAVMKSTEGMSANQLEALLVELMLTRDSMSQDTRHNNFVTALDETPDLDRKEIEKQVRAELKGEKAPADATHLELYDGALEVSCGATGYKFSSSRIADVTCKPCNASLAEGAAKRLAKDPGAKKRDGKRAKSAVDRAAGKRACMVPHCGRVAAAKGLCANHYTKARKLGMNTNNALAITDLDQLAQDGRAQRFKASAPKREEVPPEPAGEDLDDAKDRLAELQDELAEPAKPKAKKKRAAAEVTP